MVFNCIFPRCGKSYRSRKSLFRHMKQNHGNIAAEPMGDKLVTDLAGIGEISGKSLANKGFDKAYVVLGQFLVLKKNKKLFVDWLRGLSGADTRRAGDTYRCLSDFVAKRMGENPLPVLACVDEVWVKRLVEKGFDMPYDVLGQFLVLKKNKELFVDWLQDLSGADNSRANETYQYLSDWCDEFL